MKLFRKTMVEVPKAFWQAGLVVVALALSQFLSVAVAAPAAKPVKALEAQESARLAELFAAKTGMKADALAPAPVAGFVELVVGTSVFYMDMSGKWLLDGHLVELDTRTSVTALRKQSLEAADKPALDWTKLNLADAIKTARGKAVPGRVLVTFEDPNCGYCKRLVPELDKVKDLTVYTFPVSILGEASRVKNEAVWCAKNRSTAWKAALAGTELTSSAGCDLAGLKRNGELAQTLKVTGTPTMFLADGSRVAGFMDAAAIERLLASRVAKASK